MKATFDPADLRSWAEIHRILSNMRSLTILVGDTRVEGAVTLEQADDGSTVLALPDLPKAKVKGKVKGKGKAA